MTRPFDVSRPNRGMRLACTLIFMAIAICRVQAGPWLTATGGIVTNIVDQGIGYRVHIFRSNGTFSVQSGSGPVSVLVVGGGGGGGMDMGGGGGGGGVVYASTYVLPSSSVAVKVGAGGTGAPAGGVGGQPGGHPFAIPAKNGSNSVFGTITAYGGGFGGSSYNPYPPGAAGGDGSSGGGASGYSDGNYRAGGSGIAGQGFAGGHQGGQYYSGGGGGAGGPGANGPIRADGGPGLPNSILGTMYYWGGGGGGSGYWITGGNGGIGGGGGGAVGTSTGGAGFNNGLPGGGGATAAWANMPGGNAGANTGGGGGGGSHYNGNNKGGDGGSGIVVVRYPTGEFYAIRGRVTSTSGYPVTNLIVQSTNGIWNTVTTNGGYYTLLVPMGWTGAVRVVTHLSAATPATRSYANVQSDVGGQDYSMGPPPWMDYSFGKRQALEVENPSGVAVSNFPVEFRVVKEIEMAADYRDLRFTDVAGSNLSYWIERVVASNNVASAAAGGSALASCEQSGWPIANSINGEEISSGDGWAEAYCTHPVYGVYKFAGMKKISRLQIISGQGRVGWNPTLYDLHYSTNANPTTSGTWLPLRSMTFANEVSGGTIASNTVSSPEYTDDVQIDFAPVHATAIRITVRSSNGSDGSMVLTEFKVFESYAVAWVKMPVLPALSKTGLLMYYGNPAVTNAGNGDNVFTFFDDFNAAAINTTKWPTRSVGSSYITQSNGLLKVWAVNGATYYIESANFTTSMIPFALECRTRTRTGASDGWSPLQWRNTAGGSELNILEWRESGSNAGIDYGYPWWASPTPLGEYHRSGIAVLTPNTYRMTCRYDISTNNNWDSWSAGNSACSPMSGTYRIRVGPRGDGYAPGFQSMDGEVDAIWARKISVYEPEVALYRSPDAAQDVAGFKLISGRVTSSHSGQGIDRLVIATTNGVWSATTTNGGYYTLMVNAGWTGTVQIASQAASVSPAQRTYSNLQNDSPNQDYSWTPPQWLNYGFTNRVQLEIQNRHTAFLTNYQVELKIPYRAGMRADFADVRFSQLSGTNLPYWIERIVSNSSAVVWIRMPHVGALSSTNIYMYYGSPTATNGGNGDAVFRFFDDFEDGVINTNKWPTRSMHPYVTETNGELQVTGVNVNDYFIQSTGFAVSTTAPFVLEARTRTPALIWAGWTPFMFATAYPGVNGLSILDHVDGQSGQYLYRNGDYSVYMGYQPLGEYHRNTLIMPNLTNYVFASAYEQSYVQSWSSSGTVAALSGTYFVKIGPRGDYWTAGLQTGTGIVDAIWMRSYCPVAPTITALDNTRQALTNVYQTYAVSGRVRNSMNGEGVGGVRMSFSQGVDALTTVSGYYTQLMVAGWSGTVTPTYASGRFAQTAIVVSAISQATALADLYWTPAPSVTNIAPSFGLFSGGTTVLITGTNFSSSPLPVVLFGERAGTGLVRINGTTLSVVTPTNLPGQSVHVRVTNGDGQYTEVVNGFHYRAAAPAINSVTPNTGTMDGGTLVTISGAINIGSDVGTGSDGSVTCSTSINLNSNKLVAARSYADAIHYSVSGLTSTSATLTASVPAGALSVGDEVLLIQMQGTVDNHVNVGRYEFLRIRSVSGSTVSFTTPKRYYYGAADGTDANVGVGDNQQKVMLQRVPNYLNMTVTTGGVLTASAWNGTRGGVLAFRVSGTLQNNGLIDLSGKGYRGGDKGGHGCGHYPWPTTAGDRGESYAGRNAIALCDRRADVIGNGVPTPVNYGGGGGGGGGAYSPHRNGGGGGGGAYAEGGAGGNGSSSGESGGAGGDVYGTTNLSRIFLGSGGGGGGRGVNTEGGDGGRGGGILVIMANQVVVSNGAVSCDGQVGYDYTAPSDDGGGGGGGGSGGSLWINAYGMTQGATNATVSGGGGGAALIWRTYGSGGGGGAGGVGRKLLSLPRVWFGSNEVTIVSYSSSAITVLTPSNPAGVVNVRLEQPDGQWVIKTNAFTYLPEIWGSVTNAITGLGVSNVVVSSLTGGYSTTTRVDGAYSLLVPFAWTGQVRAISATPGIMAPTSRVYANVRSVQTDQHYSFSPADPVISGTISNAVTGARVEGVTVTFSAGGGIAITDANGFYSRTLPLGWTGTVTLAYTTSQGAHTFAPASRSYTNLVLAIADQNYAVSAPYFAGTRYVSLSGLNEYPYTNWLTAAWSIQAAINSCRGGETIIVGDGVYDIDALIAVNRAVTIRSHNGPTNTIVQRVAGNTGIFSITATNAVMDGLTIRGGSIMAQLVQDGWSMAYYWAYGAGEAGGVAVYNGSTIQNCVIRDNVSVGMSVPGGVLLESGAKAINCLIYNNSGLPGGPWFNNTVGGVWLGANASLINSVVYGNVGYATYGWGGNYGHGAGGVFKSGSGASYIYNSIAWGNEGADMRSMGSAITVGNSTYWNLIGNVAPDATCMRADPGFIDPAAGDFRLQPWSLAINSGIDSYIALTNDILYKPRKVFGVDRGAYEYTGLLYRVSGRVTNEYYGIGAGGVTLSFSGGVTATTEPNGYYVAVLNQGWTGTIAPSYPNGFFLAPPSITVAAGLTNELRNQLFSWRPPHPLISGRVTHGITGAGVDGVVLYFSLAGGVVTTANGGFYSQMVTGRWSGAVTSFYAQGGTFTPATRSYSNVRTNVAEQDLVWVAPTRTIVGRVLNHYTGDAVTGAVIQFSSGGGSATSAVNGIYTGRLYHGWSGRATPTHPWGGVFAPTEYRDYNPITDNVVTQDYTWVPANPIISGLVTNHYSGLGAEGVVVTFSGGMGAVTTAQDGAFSMVVPYRWTGTVTPTHVVGAFTATSRAYTNLLTNIANQTFRWTPELRPISGRVTHADTGEGVVGVNINFSNGGGSAVTTNGGYYTRQMYYTWYGSASASAGANTTVLPASRSYGAILAAVTDQDYVVYPNRTISGRVIHQDTGAGVDDMLVRRSDGGTLNTANGGYFSLLVPNGWSGSLTPEPSAGYCIASVRNYNSVSADVSDQTFVWYPPRTISGRITNQVTGVGVDDVTLRFSGVGEVQTFGGGYYAYAVQQGWSGTVTPVRLGWSFVPSPRVVTNLAVDQVVDFGGTPQTVVIAGRVRNHYTGNGVPNISVSFSGGSGNVLTDGNGNYTNQVPYTWSGTATVSSPVPGGSFDLDQRSYTGVQGWALNEDYVWTPPSLTIAGVVSNADAGSMMSGVLVTNSSGGSGLSQANGSYTVNVYYGWSGTVTPITVQGSFVPSSRMYQHLTNSLGGEHFGWRGFRNISGTISNGLTGDRLSGVVVTLSGGAGSMITSNDGAYQLSVPYAWSGTLGVSYSNWIAMPASYAFNNVVTNRTANDMGLYPPRLISGRVVNHSSGAGIDGVSLMFAGAVWSVTNTTQGGGYFTSSVPYGWSGQLIPSRPTGAFLPASRAYENVSVHATNQEFRWLQPNPTIRGRVINIASGAGVPGATIRFSDGSSVVTDGSGHYALAKTLGWSGTFWATHDTGTFSGTVLFTVTSLADDMDGQNFNWIPPDPVLGGRITHMDTGEGLVGVTVRLSGRPDVLTTNGGYYQAVVPLYWGGTVTPVAVTGRYTPSARVINNLIADRSDALFTWQPGRTISGRITETMGGHGLVGVVIHFSNSGGQITTTNGGYYTHSVLPGWTGVATPVIAGGTSQPSSQSYVNVSSDLVQQDYAWTPDVIPGNRYVSRHGSQTYPYTNWSMAATSIHVGVRAALPGEIVWLTNEVYLVDRAVEISKPIRIRTVNGAHFTTLRLSGTNASRVLYLAHGNAEVSGVTLTGGRDSGGSGAYVLSGFLNNAIVRGNTNLSAQGGAGVLLGNSVSARMANCLIYGNQAPGVTNAGGLSGVGSVVNCTIYDNIPAGAQASAFYNSIVEGPVVAPVITYTMANQVYPGLGNLTGDPQFLNRAAGDYRLLFTSPGVNAGNNGFNVLTRDMDYNPRVLHRIDLGPYELTPTNGLALALSGEVNPVPLGERFTYIVTVLNAGTNAASGIVVTSSIPAGLSYVSNSAPASYMSAGGVWTVGTIGAGERATLHVWVDAVASGAWTNGARITGGALADSHPDYLQAEYVVTVLGDVVITNLAASTSSGNSTVEWESVVGVGYTIFTSDDNYTLSRAPAWDERATMVASDEIRNYLDNDTHSSQVMSRYYHVTYTGKTPGMSNVWALIRKDVKGGSYTMLSPPVMLDRRLDGDLGAMLAEQLNGNDGGIGAGGDELYVFQDDGSWRILYLNGAKAWCESSGQPSQYELPPGKGVFIARKSGNAARITFTGKVGNTGTNRVALLPGWNLVSLSEGKDLSIATAFESANPIGGATEETADMVVLQNPSGSWRRLMRVQGWGAPYDGKWLDLSTFEISTMSLTPGQAYYYYRQPSGGTTHAWY